MFEEVSVDVNQAGDDELAADIHPRGRIRRVDVRSYFRDASALDADVEGGPVSLGGGVDDPSALNQHVGYGFLRAASVEARGMNRRRRYHGRRQPGGCVSGSGPSSDGP